MLTFSLLFFFFFISYIYCNHTKEEWKSRSIYQLLTDRFSRADELVPDCKIREYNGGSFKGIIKQLDYIKNLGFDAIWISPISKNLEGSYHGYHTIDYEKINEHFGTIDDFKELIDACHKKDIWVMVDIVLNHVGPVGSDYSQIVPFDQSIYYHDYCDITDPYNQIMVENCRLYGLPDLKQENEFVRKYLIGYAKKLVDEYGVDGFRLADTNNIPKWFWREFKNEIKVYTMGNAVREDASYLSGYADILGGMTNYALYGKLNKAFCEKLSLIEEYMSTDRKLFNDRDSLGVFLENHDKPRFLSQCNNPYKFVNAGVFTILFEGIPIFYYGGEQLFNGSGDPENRECMFGKYNQGTIMFKHISIANHIRKKYKLYNKEIVQSFSSDSVYVFTRGNALIALTRGERLVIKVERHPYNVGTELCNAFDESDCIFVETKGIQIIMGEAPKVYIPV